MARPRKPIPKTQRQLSLEQQEAFKGIENRGDSGNPNLSDGNFNANVQSTGIEFNRSKEMSFKDDDTKQYSVGIQDIDEAVFYYFRDYADQMAANEQVQKAVDKYNELYGNDAYEYDLEKMIESLMPNGQKIRDLMFLPELSSPITN